MKKINPIIKQPRYFWKEIEQRDMNLSSLLDVYSNVFMAELNKKTIESKRNLDVAKKHLIKQDNKG